MKKKKIGVIGAGVMGQAILDGLIRRNLIRPEQAWAMTKSQVSAREVQKKLGVKTVTSWKEVSFETEILLLSVKPAQLQKVLEEISPSLSPKTLLISIVAGVTLDQIESMISHPNPVVRAMTNTPVIVGKGMSVICGGSHAKTKDLEKAKEIFEAVGTCLSLDESHFNAVTGLGGSGPAYLYLVMEALADGGVRVGLPRSVALQIVAQTVLGAATMVQELSRHPAALRDEVTTPAGCTIGGLLVMEDGKIRSVLARAVEEAARIASGLGT